MRLSWKNRILIGLTLFSMFFGAGNLIFPPYLGAMAGKHIKMAFAGFVLSAAFLPALGAVAVVKSGGLTRMAGRFHSKLTVSFTAGICLLSGPLLAAPRTSTVSYTIAVAPFTDSRFPFLISLAYAALFLTVSVMLAWAPAKIWHAVGKLATPLMLLIILFLGITCLLKMNTSYQTEALQYHDAAFLQGFLSGYQTMDTMIALNFGLMIALNIRNLGIEEEKSVLHETMLASVFSSILLAGIYALLVYAGSVYGTCYGEPQNGAVVLSDLAYAFYGNFGLVLLAIASILACLGTCVGLLGGCSKFFATHFPRIRYHVWLVFFGLISFAVSSLGLDRLLTFSEPVLDVVYPVVIALILLMFLPERARNSRGLFPAVGVVTFLMNLLYLCEERGISAGAVNRFLSCLPLYRQGFGWIPAALAALIICLVISDWNSRRKCDTVGK